MDRSLAVFSGKAARRARKALGLTQADMAEQLDVSVEFYGRLERGVSLPSIETLVDARFVGSGNPIPLAPRLTGGLRVIATHDSGLRAGLRSLGLAPRPLPHGARGAPMTALDATAGYHGRRLRLDLEVENLFVSSMMLVCSICCFC